MNRLNKILLSAGMALGLMTAADVSLAHCRYVTKTHCHYVHAANACHRQQVCHKHKVHMMKQSMSKCLHHGGYAFKPCYRYYSCYNPCYRGCWY